jgi:glycosyltransferase involved in cell wall biosynthesis
MTARSDARASCTRPLRVLVVTNTYPRSTFSMASGVFVQELVRALRPFNVQSDVLVIRGRESTWHYFSALWHVRLRRRSQSYDLVHAHYGLAAAVVALAKAHPLVATFHGSDLHLAWQRPISRWAARRADACIAVSPALAALLRPVTCDVIPCGVSAERLRPLDREAACRELGWPPGPFRVLFPGHPRRAVKNYPLFAATLELLRGRGLNVREVALDGRFAHDRVGTVMSACDVMLMTSRREGSPQSVKEALATGLPVVSTDVGDVRTLTMGVHPGCVSPANPVALADAVSDVLASRRRSDGPRAIVRHGVGWREIAAQVRAVYDRVARC